MEHVNAYNPYQCLPDACIMKNQLTSRHFLYTDQPKRLLILHYTSIMGAFSVNHWHHQHFVIINWPSLDEIVGQRRPPLHYYVLSRLLFQTLYQISDIAFLNFAIPSCCFLQIIALYLQLASLEKPGVIIKIFLVSFLPVNQRMDLCMSFLRPPAKNYCIN